MSLIIEIKKKIKLKQFKVNIEPQNTKQGYQNPTIIPKNKWNPPTN